MNKLFTIAAFAVATVGMPALPAFAQAGAMPTCAAGDAVVWENTSSKSKVYHAQGDSYFGKTKHGAYACKSAAEAAGYHASGSKSSKSSSSASGSMASPDPTASASSKHHHHKKSSMTPAASPAPAPAAT